MRYSLSKNFILSIYVCTFALFPFLVLGQQISTILLPILTTVFALQILIKKYKIIRANNLTLILAFLIVNISGLLYSSNLSYALQSIYKLIACIIIYIIVLNLNIICRGDIILNINKIMRKLILVSSFVSLILVYKYKFVFKVDYVGINLIYETEAGKNQLAFFMATLLPFCIFYASEKSLSRLEKLINFICLTILIATSILIDSRGVIVSITTSIIITSILTKDKKIIYKLFTVIIIITSLIKYSPLGYKQEAYTDIYVSSSNTIRARLIEESLATSIKNLGIGIGLGDFNQIPKKLGLSVLISHNDYIQILVELGFFGLVTFLAMIYRFINNIISIKNVVNRKNIYLYRGIISSNISILVYLLFINSYNILLVWFIYGLSMAFYNYHIRTSE